MAVNLDGRLEVFAAGTDHSLQHIAQTVAGGSWGSWGSLGGSIVNNPTAVTNTNGAIEIFVLGTDFSLWHNWQTSPGGGNWFCWAAIWLATRWRF